MEIFVENGTEEEFVWHIEQQLMADYVYMYPPRQAYRRLESQNITHLVRASLDKYDSINLYFHFPFCKQICAYCNLFSHVCTDQDVFSSYIGYLKRELSYYLPWITGKQVETIYLGGGTPSLLDPVLFAHLFDFLRESFSCDVRGIPEVAIEASPDTVDRDKLCMLKEIGINRVNIGLQSTSKQELSSAGRRYGPDIGLRGLEIIREVGFDNVCVDLIYGLQGQSFENWRDSVKAVIDYDPETVCAYPLALRPNTGFDVKGYKHLSGRDQYAKYDYINETLSAEGYRQETHVRWIKNERGGYRQKANHWALKNVLGLGAGARSYLWYCDLRNGYSVKHRTTAFRSYLSRVDEHGSGRSDGFILDDEERRRKAIILGLTNLDRHWFAQKFDVDPLDVFPVEFEILTRNGFLYHEGSCLKLSPLGIRHRDIIVQRFFSPRVRNLLNKHDYNE